MDDINQLTLEINPEDQSTFGPCSCCGQMTSRVWGYVYRSNMAQAVYYVEWTPGHDGSEANFDLIVGQWGEDATASDRQAIAVEYRRLESGPAFRIIDARGRNFAESSLVGEALERDHVIGTDLATHVFAICDAVLFEDPRLSEIRGGWVLGS